MPEIKYCYLKKKKPLILEISFSWNTAFVGRHAQSYKYKEAIVLVVEASEKNTPSCGTDAFGCFVKSVC